MKIVNKKKTITISIAAALAVAMAGVGATLAVMSKTTEKRANNFTFGSVSIELEEPEWDKSDEEDHTLYPGKTVHKDPTVTNTGINDLYVFLEVQIPRAYVRVVDDEDKTLIHPAKTIDLLKYTVNSGWTVVKDVEPADADTYHTIVYLYENKLSAKDITEPLFDQVTFVNAVEGEPESAMTFEMPINAYAIQADYLDDIPGADIKEKLIKAYEIYFENTN